MSAVYYRNLLLRTWWLVILSALLVGRRCLRGHYHPVPRLPGLDLLNLDRDGLSLPPAGSTYYPPEHTNRTNRTNRDALRPAAPGSFSLLRYDQRPVTAPAPQPLVLPRGTPAPGPDALASRAMDRPLASPPQVDAQSIILDAPPLLGHLRMGRAASVLLRHVYGVLPVVDLQLSWRHYT